MTASAPPVFAAHVQEDLPLTSDPIPLDETTPQSFSISTPLDRNFITSVSRSGARRLSLDSRISPGLSLQYRQAWTTLFSTDFGYRFEYTSYDSGNTFHQDSHSLHRLTASGSFRFGEHQKLILGVGESQDFFLHDPLSGDSELTRAWIPEVSFGSKSRLYSTGMGDLFLGGSLAILLPAEIENGPHVYTGFSQELSLSFENPIGASDTLSFSGSLRHANQNSTVENRAATRTQLGASYTLSLPR